MPALYQVFHRDANLPNNRYALKERWNNTKRFHGIKLVIPDCPCVNHD